MARERDAATQRLWETVYAALTERQRLELDALLVVAPGARVSELERRRVGPAAKIHGRLFDSRSTNRMVIAVGGADGMR